MIPFWFQALKYMDYIFTGVFTFEMVIKVSCVHAPPTPLLCSCALLTHTGWLRPPTRTCGCALCALCCGTEAMLTDDSP